LALFSLSVWIVTFGMATSSDLFEGAQGRLTGQAHGTIRQLTELNRGASSIQRFPTKKAFREEGLLLPDCRPSVPVNKIQAVYVFH
jgi:hypothetical protein